LVYFKGADSSAIILKQINSKKPLARTVPEYKYERFIKKRDFLQLNNAVSVNSSNINSYKIMVFYVKITKNGSCVGTVRFKREIKR